MKGLFSDVLVVAGGLIVLFSLGLILFIFVGALPTSNPYIGFFTLILIPILFIIGGIIFFLGIVAERRENQDKE